MRNLLTEWTARSARVPLVVPSPREVYGLDTIEADAADLESRQSAFFVLEEDVTPAPLTNLPPDEDNGTHHNIRRLPHFQAQWGTFLTTGRMFQACSGPCDPD